VTSASSEFAGRTCTAPAERSDRLRDLVLQHVPRNRRLRVLDLGCGTGSLVRRLAEALPDATLVGIDLSTANVDAANQQLHAADPARMRFVVADYLHYRGGLFDVIVSDGVLHLIPGSTPALAGKLAADLEPGGLFICGMPYDCLYNRAFSAVRRILRKMRSPVTDRAILAVGHLLHGRQMDDNGLRERVAYMYVPPERMMGRSLIASLNAAGLQHTTTHPMRSTSPSQLRHNVTVWAKASAA
jgi:SAM-dependent methyltransferase